MRCVRELQPLVFVLENVHGFKYSGKEEGFQLLHYLTDEINKESGCNYHLSWAVLNAADYGVPQIRTRFFLVAHRAGKNFDFPAATHYDPSQPEGDLLTAVGEKKPYVTAWDAIGRLSPEERENLKVKGRWADLLPSIPEGENYLWHTKRKGGLPLFGWRTRYWSFLLKLAKHRPSWTIQAQPGPAIGPFHWANRLLSERELAALQTFPRDVRLSGTRISIQKQLGNAVPSLLAEVLAREIGLQFFGMPKRKCKLSVRLHRPIPRPERVIDVPQKFLKQLGDHADHPGTGKGRKARSRNLNVARDNMDLGNAALSGLFSVAD
jgi:DNA (cytosine-5)-methyltransferase 1